MTDYIKYRDIKGLINSTLIPIIIVLIVIVFQALNLLHAKAYDEKSPFYVSAETKTKLSNFAHQTYKTITADLFYTNFFVSVEGKEARLLLLNLSDGKDEVIEDAIRLLYKAVEKKDSHAMAWLAALYQIGAGSLDVDFQKSVNLFEQSAILNDPFGLYNIGFFHEKGKLGFEKSRDKALAFYDRSNDKGGHWTLKRLGDAYNKSNQDLNIERDKQYAVELYKKAINKGSMTANVALSEMYLSGEGLNLPVEAQLIQTDKLGKELCATKTVYGAKGCFFVAQVEYEEYRKLKIRNNEKKQRIESMLKRSYSRGNGFSDAAALLASIYHYGDIQAKAKEIHKWFDLGCPEEDDNVVIDSYFVGNACYLAGRAYISGSQNWNLRVKDKNKALSYYERSFREKYAESFASLGYDYLNGITVSKDELRGYKLIKRGAVEFSAPNALQMLADFYVLGKFVEKNLKVAQNLNKESALLGSRVAMEKYAQSFVVDSSNNIFLQNPDYENCYLWSLLSRKRNFSKANTYKFCGEKVSETKKTLLSQKVDLLNKRIPLLR